jgi:hypothetical protein
MNTSLNGFYTNTLREAMPANFSIRFRARRGLEYISPGDIQNYRIKGYQPI